MKAIMVLADGETYSEVDSCKIVYVPDSLEEDEIEGELKHLNLDPRGGSPEGCYVVTTFSDF